MNLVAYLQDNKYKHELEEAANYLNIEIVSEQPTKNSFISYDRNGLYFIYISSSYSKKLHIDFLSGSMGWRLKRTDHEKLLKKTLGKTKEILNIFDGTAGLLSDSLIFLSLGHNVVACEQSKILFLLVKDACNRAKTNLPFLANLKLKQGNSHEVYIYEKDLDVIYLDPMYPKIKRNTLRSGNINLIRSILELEEIKDLEEGIVKKFFETDYKKIILKRPIKAQKVCSNINYQVKGKSTRFDIYI